MYKCLNYDCIIDKTIEVEKNGKIYDACPKCKGKIVITRKCCCCGKKQNFEKGFKNDGDFYCENCMDEILKEG